jgi:hypothetical protein
MKPKSGSLLWDDGWGTPVSGGTQDEMAAGNGQTEATGNDFFFGYQYLFAPAEAPPHGQYTEDTDQSSEYTESTPINELRSVSERSVTPGRHKRGRRKGNRRREEERKRGQNDTDVDKKRWYQSTRKEVRERTSRKEPYNVDELLERKDLPQDGDEIMWLQAQKPTRKQLGKKDYPQIRDERNQLQVQKKSEDTAESSNFLNFIFDKGNDGTRDLAPDSPAKVTKQSATENDRNPTKGRESTGDSSLPFLNYFWKIEATEEAPSSSASKAAAILEARDEGLLPEKSSLQEDDEVPLKAHRLKRWFSTTPKRNSFGSSQDTSRLEEEDVLGRGLFSQNYGSNVEAGLEEEDFSKSRSCMSFRRHPKAKGSGLSFSRVLSKSFQDSEMDQTGKDKRQRPHFITGLSLEDAPNEEDYIKSKNCMSFRLEARRSARDIALEQDYGVAVEHAREEEEEEEDYSKSRNCMSFRFSSPDSKTDQSEKNDREDPRFEKDITGSKVDQDNDLSVYDAREEEDYTKSKSCMSFRRNSEATGGGIFSGRALDESRKEPTSRQGTLTIEEEEEIRRKEMPLLTVVRHNGPEGRREELVQYERNKSSDDNEQVASQWRAPRVQSRKMGKHELAARRNWLARHGTLDQDYGANVDDVQEEEDYSETRNCMSFRKNPSTKGIFLGRLDESRRGSTSRPDILPIKKEKQYMATGDVSPLQDVSRQELDGTLPRKEGRPFSLPAAKLAVPANKPSLPTKEPPIAPIRQSRSEVEERVQPLSPKSASTWRGDMWGLLSLDSLDAEESTRCETRNPAPRKPIRINRSTSKKQSPIDLCSVRAASWDSYDDEQSYSDSSVSSVFSLESLEAW